MSLVVFKGENVKIVVLGFYVEEVIKDIFLILG